MTKSYALRCLRGTRESAALELERDLDLGAIGFDPAFGIQLHIELHDFGDAKVAKRLAGAVDCHFGGLFPGILAGADQLDDLVNAISHKRPPVVVRQDACCSCRPGSLTSRFPRRKAQSALTSPRKRGSGAKKKARPAKAGRALLSLVDASGRIFELGHRLQLI